MENSSANLDLTEVVVADHCHLRIRSLPELIVSIVDFLIQRATQCGAVHPGRANRVLIALHEALTNSLLHGNLGISSDLKERGDQSFAAAVSARCADPAFGDRTLDIQATYDGRTARWVFVDQGEGFDVAQAMQRLETEAADPFRACGRGLFLIRAFVDEMRYDDRGRRLTLALRRSSGEEKREHPRFPMAQEVRVTPIDSDGKVRWEAGHEAIARDISSQGIGFLQAHLAEYTRVFITIPTAGDPIMLPAEVRRCHQVGDQVEVGCRFEAADPALLAGIDPVAAPGGDPLGKLVDWLTEQQKPLAERRISPRLPYTECIVVEAANLEAMRGFARDLSRSGIAFFTTANLPLEAVRLTLPPSEDAPAITVRAQVVRCTRLTDSFYDVAARFLPA